MVCAVFRLQMFLTDVLTDGGLIEWALGDAGLDGGFGNRDRHGRCDSFIEWAWDDDTVRQIFFGQ